MEMPFLDGSSEDGDIEYLQQFPNIRIIMLEEPFSLPKGKNRSVPEAHSSCFLV